MNNKNDLYNLYNDVDNNQEKNLYDNYKDDIKYADKNEKKNLSKVILILFYAMVIVIGYTIFRLYTNNKNELINKEKIPVQSIKLNVSETTINKGETLDLIATIDPINASNKNINWSSSNPNVATVENGKVKAIEVGTTLITAKISNEKMATCNINVVNNNNGNSETIVNKSFVLDTSHTQTKFYKYGTFTTKGLELLENGKKVGNFNPEIIEYPNLQDAGSKIVKLKYNNQELSYNISVRGNRVGDLITLKDGSRWYYLANKNNEIHLLSVFELKQQCGSSCILTFTTNKDSYDSYWTTKFDETNKDYDASSLKSILYNKFKNPYLTSLKSKTGVDTSSIKIDLPDAVLLSELLGGNGTDGYVTGDGHNRYVSMFLKGYKTYWTKTRRNTSAVYTVHESNGKVGWAINNKTMSYAIRPEMIIPANLLEQLVIKHDNKSDGQLDLVSSLDYIIYDVKNGKIIREEKKIDSRYSSGLKNGEFYLGPNTNNYLYPASITKLTTVMLALEKINAYGISLDTPITIDSKLKQCCKNFYSGGDNCILNYDKVTYRDLLYASLYKSSWDATAELAILLTNKNGEMGINKNYQLGFDTSKLDSSKYVDCEKLDASFALEMNDFVNKKILKSNKNTFYKNTSGFLREGHYTTLYDTALILSYAMSNPTFKNIFTNPSYRSTYTSSYVKYIEKGTEKKLTINNPSSPIFGLEYMIGGKIGNATWTSKKVRSGHNWALYYEKDGHGYVIFTAEADSNLQTVGNLNMINDQFLIYQWLFR